MHKYQFENGLTLVHVEKKDFEKAFAAVVVNYGSKNIYYNETFPLGIAHFLEHKMFEKNGEDYLEAFAKIGASVNAFTSYFVTAYYFNTTQKLDQPFNMLLDLVSELSIDAQSVEKEKGIIEAELSMYESDPETKMFHRLLENMYENAPIKYDIGGTKESVHATTLDDLKRCFELFYNPNNLTICVVGSISLEETINLINNHAIMSKKATTLPKEINIQESEKVVVNEDIIELEVEDKVLLGYKLNVLEDYRLRKKMEVSLNVLITLTLTSLNSDYQNWIKNGYINDYFGAYVDASKHHFSLVIYAETKADNFVHGLYDLLINYEISETMLKNIQRRLYSSQIRLQDSFERLGLYLANANINQVESSFELDLLKNISLQDLKDAQLFLRNYSKTTLNVKKAVK